MICGRITTFVIRAARRTNESTFLIGTCGVWEQTGCSLSHHPLSPLLCRETPWPPFSPIIHARVPVQLRQCDMYLITRPKSLPHRISKLPLSPLLLFPFIHNISDLGGICTDRSTFFFPPCACPEKNRRSDRGGTRLCGTAWRQTDRQTAQRQQADKDLNALTLC